MPLDNKRDPDFKLLFQLVGRLASGNPYDLFEVDLQKKRRLDLCELQTKGSFTEGMSGDRLKLGKSDLSYADFHHEITKTTEGNNSKCSGNWQMKRVVRKANDEAEVVKYMSNLPGYLERGKKIHEKALNVGVLDWRRLEKWQNSHKTLQNTTSIYLSAPTCSYTSLSPDVSSNHSKRGHSCSPTHERFHSALLKAHLMGSHIQGHSEEVKSSEITARKQQDKEQNLSDSVNKQRKSVCTSELFHKNVSDRILEICHEKESYPKVTSGPQSFANVKACGLVYSSNLGMATRSSESDKRIEGALQTDKNAVDRDIQTKSKPIVLLLARNLQNNNAGVAHKSDSQIFLDKNSENAQKMYFREEPMEVLDKEPGYDLSHSCPLPRETNCNHFHSGDSSYGQTDHMKCSTGTCSGQRTAKVGLSSSKAKSRNVDGRKLTMLTNSAANESTSRLHHTVNKVTSEKRRTSSPFRKFGIGSSVSKNLDSKEGGQVAQSSSIIPSSSGSQSEIPPASLDGKNKATSEKQGSSSPFSRFSIGSSVSKNSGSKEGGQAAQASSSVPPNSGSHSEIPSAILDGNEKSSAKIKGRSSPLRRLLDPLLKVKTANCRQYGESSTRDAISICRDSKSANANSPQSGKEKSSPVTSSVVEINNSSQEKVHAMSTVQALLQIAMKNGLPLFTFAVDNHSEILAATVKKLNNSRKNGCTRIYTFFTFQEVKRKNGIWIIQGGKSKGPDYSPHVIAQMKVSETRLYDVTGQDCFQSSKMKEFVLFSVKLRQGDDRFSDYQPIDELAAIVARVHPKINSVTFDRHKHYVSDVQDSMTVVLPSGVHSLPSCGGPSSLIERWKSGGSCDCGGWDLGCKLKTLDNKKQVKTADTSNAHVKDDFKLYLEGNGQENRPAFSFSPFKHGLYSIAFDSSFSLLQAFSICIAMMDPCELSESSSCIEDDTSKETIPMHTHEVVGDTEGSYVSIPPLFPFGRV